jgi:hypothetical protein
MGQSYMIWDALLGRYDLGRDRAKATSVADRKPLLHVLYHIVQLFVSVQLRSASI